MHCDASAGLPSLAELELVVSAWVDTRRIARPPCIIAVSDMTPLQDSQDADMRAWDACHCHVRRWCHRAGDGSRLVARDWARHRVQSPSWLAGTGGSRSLLPSHLRAATLVHSPTHQITRVPNRTVERTRVWVCLSSARPCSCRTQLYSSWTYVEEIHHLCRKRDIYIFQAILLIF